MIELIPNLPDNAIGFSAKGDVTSEDYETILIPAVEAKLKEYGKIRLLYHLGPEFKSYKAGAMWDDTKVGLQHLTSWERIALVTDVEWIRAMAKVFGFMMHCHFKIYHNDQLAEAEAWIRE